MYNSKNFSILKNKISLMVVLILIIAINICCLNTSVFAEISPDSSIVFNQLSRAVDYSLTGNFTISGNDYLYQSTNVSFLPTPNKNHKYYFKADLQSSNLTYITLFANGWNVSINLNNNGVIYSNIETFSRFYYYSNASGSQTVKFTINVIDLTQMFGAGNEPTLEEINNRNLFPSFYSYTSGTVLLDKEYSSFLNGYNKALADVSNSIDTVLAVSDSYNTIQNGNVTGFRDKIAKEIMDIDGKQMYIVSVPVGAIAYIPIYIKAGSTININSEYYYLFVPGETTPQDYPLTMYFSTKIGNQLIDLYEIEIEQGEETNITNISFTADNDIAGLYLYASELLLIGNMQIEYTTTDLQKLITQAQSTGYENGYQYGYQDAIYDMNKGGETIEGAWAFIRKMFTGLGDILALEFIPNFPLWIFVAIPLFFGILILIMKVIGG